MRDISYVCQAPSHNLTLPDTYILTHFFFFIQKIPPCKQQLTPKPKERQSRQYVKNVQPCIKPVITTLNILNIK